MTNAHYLQDQSVIIEGLKFYGSPWQPTFHNWAFNKDRGEKIKTEWDKIPSDTDVLITHGPPFGILDKTVDNEKVGCEELLLAVNRIKPKIHIFGHIHENYGEIKLNGTHFINPSSCDYNYIPR
jgi:Icc-related predicted phosphoesterase